MLGKYKEYAKGTPVFTFPAPIPVLTQHHDPSTETKVVSVHLNKTKLKLKIGQVESLIVTVLPAHAANQAVTWTIANPAIAELTFTHHKAFLKAKQTGRTTVIVTTENGKHRDLCTITIHDYLTTNK
jgi:uncharacterized protein YjdB